MTMNANGPPKRAAHRNLITAAPSPPSSRASEHRVTELLELSRERDIYESRIISAWREAFARGREVGRQEGYEQRLDEEAAEGRETVEVLRQAIGPIVNPEGHVRRVLAAAESAERRDAAARERAFVAKAYATPPHLRSDAQRATVQAYPPARKDGAA